MRHLTPAQVETVEDLRNLKHLHDITGWDEKAYTRRVIAVRDTTWRRRRLKRIARYTRLVEMGKPLGGQT
jgi:hypothetical protein